MNATPVCAILAAGRARRFGSSKAALEFERRSFVERALEAAGDFPTVVVAREGDTTTTHAALRFGARVVKNDAPARGMSHSLRLADRALSASHERLVVLLVDTPFVDADVVLRVLRAAEDADVAYPVSDDGRPGHPVVFGARARRAIDALPDGDTLRTLRDDPRFSRVRVRFGDERPFIDVDTPADYARIQIVAGAVSGRSINIASPKE